MLVVEPESAMDPLTASVTVFTIRTALVPESKASSVARFEDRTISPAALKEPAPISATRRRVSSKASTIPRPGNADPATTVCEARTRVVKPLGGFLGLDDPPQERQLMLAMKRILEATTALFKREAPKDVEDDDFNAKWQIIADPKTGLGRSDQFPELQASPKPKPVRVHKPAAILYSQQDPIFFSRIYAN